MLRIKLLFAFTVVLIIWLSVSASYADVRGIGMPGGGSSVGTRGRLGTSWEILNGLAQVYPVGNGAYFDFTTGTPIVKGVNYLTRPFKIPATAKGLQMQYTVDTFGTTPWFDFRTNTNNTCNLPGPGQMPVSTVRLMIWISPDMWTQTYRYWSQVGFRQLGAGTAILKADLDPNLWTDVYGKTGASNPAAWSYILQNANRAGVTFGGGCFYGHGVFVDEGTGRARFTVNSFGAY